MYYNIFMPKIKEPSVSGMFYPSDREVLEKQINNFAQNIAESEYKSRAVIVPHAGLVYSGQLAFEGINCLKRDIKNLFIFAPAHRVAFEGLSLSGFDEWKTPLGNIELNQTVNRELEEKFNAKIFDEAFREEHSVEIQLPIIQTIFENVKIIPVLVGRENPEKITEIISEYYPNQDFGFIISSDLSHFLTDEQAKQIDGKTAEMIESGDIQNFSYEQACGAVGIYGLVQFANKNNYSLIRVNMYNSSLVTDDKSRVVGYGSWMLYEGTKNRFIKEYYSEYSLKLCRDVIEARLNGSKIITDHPTVFESEGACFVTLKKHGHLRGCIGSIIAHRPLIIDLLHNAQNAAFSDPRFNPVSKDEIKDLTIDISLLSTPKQMKFQDEADFMNQIVPFKDGIIIKDGHFQAVYLPSVWEEIPDKETFIRTLKMKAGLPPNHFSKTFEAFRFETEYIT